MCRVTLKYETVRGGPSPPRFNLTSICRSRRVIGGLVARGSALRPMRMEHERSNPSGDVTVGSEKQGVAALRRTATRGWRSDLATKGRREGNRVGLTGD